VVRSQRVPNLKTAQTCVAFQDRGRASVKKKPASRSDRGAGIGRVPCLQNFGLRARIMLYGDLKRSVMASKITGF
jgi:hypothetical protein